MVETDMTQLRNMSEAMHHKFMEELYTMETIRIGLITSRLDKIEEKIESIH